MHLAKKICSAAYFTLFICFKEGYDILFVTNRREYQIKLPILNYVFLLDLEMDKYFLVSIIVLEDYLDINNCQLNEKNGKTF